MSPLNHDKLSTVETPVSELLCADLKMSSILRDSGPLHAKEMPFFMSLLDDVINRWYSAIGQMNKGIYSSYHEDIGLVSTLRFTFDKFLRCDDEGTFPIRKELYDVCHLVIKVIDKMANVFSGPDELRDFYHNISSRLLGTLESIPEGENGW
jgi:hypothetical protein